MSSENIATPAAAAAAPAPSLELEEWTLDVLAGCARDMGFSQWQLTHTPGSGAGDNFMGIVLRVNIAGTRNGTPDSRETVILKMPPQSAARRKQFNSAHLFEREILVYRDVLPLFVQFQLERGLKPQDANGFVAFPKCLACVCDAAQERYAIVLEDLKAQGCRMFDKSTIIDLAHVRLVMEAMGQLHGVSFALRDQRPLEFEPLAKLRDVFLNYVIKGLGHTMSDFIPAAFDRAIKTLRDDETALKAKLTHARDNYIAELEECVKLGAAGEYSVLNHGDCWNNNMMYQYGDHSNQPQRICLIDWQLARCGSPITDMVYFLFTSTTKELRDAHMEDILSIYHAALSATVTKLGSDAERLFSYATFRREWLKFGRYGLLVAPMMMQVITSDPDEIPDLDQVAEEREKSGEYKSMLSTSAKTEKHYAKRMSDVLRDLQAYGFLGDL